MKSILCYGDSNTWGTDPKTGRRLPFSARWPGVLQECLGANFHVIEEGLGGRTTVWDDPIDERMNGKTYLAPCLQSHAPLDLVILLLGTNDVKYRFSATSQDIAFGVLSLVRMIKTPSIYPPFCGVPEVLVLIPPPVKEVGPHAQMFQGAAAKSQAFSRDFRMVFHGSGAHLMETSRLVVVSDTDGIHFQSSSHQPLGQAVAEEVRLILKT